MVSSISSGRSPPLVHRSSNLVPSSLLYGFSQPSSIYYYYRHYSFYYRADENGVKLPKIHLILCKASSLQPTGEPKPSRVDELEACWRSIYDTYSKHRDAFESRAHERTNASLGNHVDPYAPVDTFDEFLSHYVMRIGHETNVVSRIAVKSHSPLLAVKHPHHSYEHQSNAHSFDKTLNDIVERI